MISNKIVSAKLFLTSKSFKSILWLFLEKVVRLGFGFVVGIWLAKYLGPTQFGKWSYAVTIIALFQIFPHWGLSTILIKDLVSATSQLHNRLMGSAFLFKLVIGLIIIGGIIASGIFNLLDGQMMKLLIIMSIVYVFQSLDVIDYYFQSKVLSKYLSIVKFSGFIFSSLLKILFIVKEMSLLWFSLSFVSEYLIISYGLFLLYKRTNQNVFNWRIKKSHIKMMIISGIPLLFSGIANWIYIRIDQILIKEMLDYEQLGIYSLSLKIVEGFYFLPVIIVSTFYPYLVRARKDSESALNDWFLVLTGVLVFTSIIISLGLTFFSENIILLAFEKDYLETIEILKIHSWSLVLISLGLVSLRWLIIQNKKRYVLLSTVLGALLNVVLNILLIPRYGLQGAAISTVISQSISVLFVNIIFSATRELFILQIKSFLFFGVWNKLNKLKIFNND